MITTTTAPNCVYVNKNRFCDTQISGHTDQNLIKSKVLGGRKQCISKMFKKE